MKVLYDVNNQKVIWRGYSYTVDGKEVLSYPSNILYLDEKTNQVPEFDSQIEYLTNQWVVDEVNNEYRKEYIINNYTELDLLKKDWKYDNYSMRMILAESVIFTHVGFYAFLQLEGFPIEKRNEYIHVWINIIRDDHQSVVDDLIEDGLLTIEQKPY